MKIKFDLKPGINHIFIPVYINGKGPYNFTLDTGAQKTTISSALVEELGLETEEIVGEKYESLKEKRNLKRTEASLSVGSEELITDDVWAMDLAFSTKVRKKKMIQSSEDNGNEVKRVAQPAIQKMIRTTDSGEKVIQPTRGVIGYSTLKNYLLSVNYRTKILQLEKSNTGFTHKNQEQLQKFEYISNTHLVGIPVMINDDGPFPFVLDTGAGGTTISKKLHEKMNLPLRDIAVKVVGVYGAQETSMAIIDQMKVSTNIYENVNAVIIDESTIGPRAKEIENGILGYNIFREREIIIDYINQTCAII
ncbi:MAG: retroviral-like aspartic protease family protein [Candidatus Bathyarchaeota archaeon]|nr:retroviral-like aspartic protease family protein [Candidatus Bathyarchaeota archaeon]